MKFNPQDYYFKKAKSENYLARSVYKLSEIQQKFKIIEPSMQVLDIGYYPGSWIQYVAEKLGPTGRIVGIDLQPVQITLASDDRIQLIQGDIENFPDLKEKFHFPQFSLILSDMAPKTSGVKIVDQQKSFDLTEIFLRIVDTELVPGGNAVVKVFDGPGMTQLLKTQKTRFEKLDFLRPKGTRDSSKEFYAIYRHKLN